MRRSQTAPVTPTLPHHNEGVGSDSQRGYSDDVIRRHKQEIAQELASRFAPTSPAGEKREGERDGQQGGKAGLKGLTNGAEHPKRKRFQKLTGRRRRVAKESLIQSADFDRVGQPELSHAISSSDSEDDDCFTDEVGGAKRSEFRSLLLFIPLRLGQDKFNMEYKEAIKV